MIKFFRKIRYDLMEKNKTGKYLKYAIGEIVLVMVGILLALQVNNWNESKKANINFKKSLEKVFNDLEIDLKNAEETITVLNNRSIIADSIINGMYSASDYRENQSSFNLVFSFPDFYITDMGFKALMQKSEYIPDEYEQLINDLNKQFITIKELLGSIRKALFENVTTTKLRYVRNFPWLSQNDSVSTEKRIQYYVNNPIYKNEVDNYRSIALGDYYNAIGVFFSQGLDLYLIIKDIINNTNQIPSFFPKNADDYKINKFDYLGKYSTKSGDNHFINEKNGYLVVNVNCGFSLLTLISNDKFKIYANARVLTFKRDESNKVIGFNNGDVYSNKVEPTD